MHQIPPNLTKPQERLRIITDVAGAADDLQYWTIAHAFYRDSIVATTIATGDVSVSQATQNFAGFQSYLKICISTGYLDKTGVAQKIVDLKTPVYQGRDLNRAEHQDNYFGKNGIGDVPGFPGEIVEPYQPHYEKSPADVMLEHYLDLTEDETLRIFCGGPLTNIIDFLNKAKKEPRFKRYGLQQIELIMMGGNLLPASVQVKLEAGKLDRKEAEGISREYWGVPGIGFKLNGIGLGEFNFNYDPEAAYEVMRMAQEHNGPQVIMVPWNACKEVTNSFPSNQIDKWASFPLTGEAVFGKALTRWRNEVNSNPDHPESGRCILCDVNMMASVIDPSCAVWEKGKVHMSNTPGMKGLTFYEITPDGHIWIAKDFNQNKMVKAIEFTLFD